MLNEIIDRQDLSFDESYKLFNNLLEENKYRIAAYLAALQTKGYTSEEVAGLAKAMRDNAIKIELGSVADTCGTGGDNSHTINVSTATAIILSCFKPVAKHGNVSVTSKSGSANVLESLKFNIKLAPEEAKECIEKTGFTFLLAPLYHPALKKIMPVRKQLGIKTVFNILGPLANPANPDYQLLGVNSPDLVGKVAYSLKLIGIKKALVVHGSGLDEMNPSKETVLAEVKNNRNIETYTVNPEDFGLESSKITSCNSSSESAERILKVFSGAENEDANYILINAATALYAAEVVKELPEGIEAVKNTISEGKVIKKVEEIRNACNP